MALTLIILLILIICDGKNLTITILEVANLDGEQEGTQTGTTGGHLIAIQQVNNDTNILPNIAFNLQSYDSNYNTQEAITKTLNLVDFHSNATHIYFPIILGHAWSSFSTVMNPILATFNKGQISASATSIALSERSEYPYFYRTIPTDELQAQGLILLCKQFNWTSVAIVYVNNAYGLYLSLDIQDLARDNGISAATIAVTAESESTYLNAAAQIKDLGVYIIILILSNTQSFFNVFKNELMTGYPYYYLGCDAWFSTSVLEQWDIADNNAAKGYIGTVPWQTDSLDLNFYDDDELQELLTESLGIYERALNDWSKYHDEGNQYFVTERPGQYMMYAYDAIFTIVHIIETLSNLTLLTNDGSNEWLIEEMNRIITEGISFVGISGNVSFDENGDRNDGLYSFGNVAENGIIQYFGYFYRQSNGSIAYKIDESLIIWPDDFTEKGVIPRSNVLIYSQLEALYKSESITMIVLFSISIIIAIGCIIFLLVNRKNTIIKAASFNFNIIMCFGAILGYSSGIIMAIQDYFIESHDVANDALCNIRFWSFIIAYSLLFMPLFVKTYRLSLIFKTILKKKPVSNAKLFIIVLIAVVIDIVLLTICTAIQPSHRILYNGEYEVMDELQARQYQHCTCSLSDSDDPFNWSSYIILLFFKTCQLLWGLYVALDVSRIKDITGILSQFDETGIQLLSILFTVIIICIDVPIYAFGPVENPHFYFLIITITILLIGNLVIILNLSPRMYAVITANDDDYKLSAAERIESRIIKHLGYNTPKGSIIKLTPSIGPEMVNRFRSNEKITID